MHALENIGRCINFIQKTYHTDKHTTSGTAKIRSQMLSVRIYIRDQQKQCHTYTQSSEILIIFFFARAELNGCLVGVTFLKAEFGQIVNYNK